MAYTNTIVSPTGTGDPTLGSYPRYLLPLGGVLLWVAYLAICGVYLYFTHPHEDAYILYNYVNNFLEVGEIVYHQSGEPAEGATDFLWFAVLTLFTALTRDPAVAAAIINGLGVVLIYYSAYRLLCHWQVARPLEVAFLFSLFLELPYISYHSYAGFGTFFYSAFVFSIFSHYIRRDYRYFPLLLLILGLIRPDGLIIAFGFFVLALADHQYQHRSFLIQLGIAFAIGAVYFITRMYYFGSVLPLPLIVKSHGSSDVNGLSENIDMVQHYGSVFVLAIVFFLLTYRKFTIKRLLIAGIPLWLHFIVFIFAHQSQNISFRFQFPLLVIVSFYLFLQAARFIATRKSRQWRYFAVVFLGIFIVGGKCYSAMLLRSNPQFTQSNHYDYYINTFAQDLPHFVDATTVMALTEAGRIPYWIDCELYDLVGLNTRHTANHPPTQAYLDSIDSDIFFIHTNHTLDYDERHVAQTVTPVTIPELIGQIDAEFLPLLSAREDTITYQNIALPNTKLAPIMVYRYLMQHPDKYDLFLAKHRSHSPHLYAFRRGEYPAALIDSMRAAYDQANYRGYLDLKVFQNIRRTNTTPL